MTTATFPVSAAPASTAAAKPNTFFARLWAEVSAFFEEMHAAQVRTGQREPFGL